MKIKSISYSQSYEMSSPYGLKTWEKIGIDADMEDGDTPIECSKHLREQVNAIHSETLTQLDLYRGTVVREIPTIDTTIEGIIEDINGCTSIDETNSLNVQTGLLAYEQVASTNPEIKAAYDLKMIQLTKK